MSPKSSGPAQELEWELCSQRRGLSGHVQAVTRTYRMPDGTIQDWDILESGPTVAVLALTENSQVVMVRQFRPGPGVTLLEMPGGMVEPEESILAAAARELLEETGYHGQLESAGSCWLSARDTRRSHVAVAREATLVAAPSLDEGEFCETVLISLDRFRELLREGDLTDVDLGYLALDHLGRL